MVDSGGFKGQAKPDMLIIWRKGGIWLLSLTHDWDLFCENANDVYRLEFWRAESVIFIYLRLPSAYCARICDEVARAFTVKGLEPAQAKACMLIMRTEGGKKLLSLTN